MQSLLATSTVKERPLTLLVFVLVCTHSIGKKRGPDVKLVNADFFLSHIRLFIPTNKHWVHINRLTQYSNVELPPKFSTLFNSVTHCAQLPELAFTPHFTDM